MVRDETTTPSTQSYSSSSPPSWPKALSRVQHASRQLRSQQILLPSSSSPHVHFLVCPHVAQDTLRIPRWDKPPTSNPLLQHALTNSNGDTWKRQRPIITRAFSTYQKTSRDHAAAHMAIHVALSRIMDVTTASSSSSSSSNTVAGSGVVAGVNRHALEFAYLDVWNFITCQSSHHGRWIDGRELALEIATKAMVVAVFGERGLDEIEFKMEQQQQQQQQNHESVLLHNVDLEEDDTTTIGDEEQECSVKLPELIQDLFRDTLQLIPKRPLSEPAPSTDEQQSYLPKGSTNSWQIFHQAVESIITDIDLELRGEVETGIFDEGLQDCLVVQLLRYQLEEEEKDETTVYNRSKNNHVRENTNTTTTANSSSSSTPAFENDPYANAFQDIKPTEYYDKDCEGTVATSISEDMEDTNTVTSKTNTERLREHHVAVTTRPSPPKTTVPRSSSTKSSSRSSKGRLKRRATDSHYLSRQEVVGNAHSALMAGTQTIATTLTGALLHLAERPELQDLLQKSVETAERNAEEEDDDDSSSSRDCEDDLHTNEKRLTGMDVVLETLRILPPVGGLPRVLVPVDSESRDVISIKEDGSNQDVESISIGCPRHSMKGTVNMGDTMVIDTLAFAHAQPLNPNKVLGEGKDSSSGHSSWVFDPLHKKQSHSQPWGIGSRKCPAGLLSVECISQVLEALVDQRIRWEFATPLRDTVGATGTRGWIEDVAYQPTLSYLRPIPLIFERLSVLTPD